MWVVLLVLWYAVGLLCVSCLNQEDSSQHDWFVLPMYLKFILTTLAPATLIMLRVEGAFKK